MPKLIRKLYSFDEERLLFPAAPPATEFEVQWRFNSSVIGAYTFKVSAAAYTQITCWGRGPQLGLSSFLAPADE